MSISRRQYLQGAGSLVAAGVLARTGIPQAFAQEKLADLPSTMIWSTYDVGSTGYVEASAIADAFGKQYGTRVRLQPSGSAIGRVKPLIDGRVSHAWLANELRGLGLTLAVGQVVTTGTCMIPVPVAAGDEVRADYGPLGRVSVRFTA